MTKRNGIYAGGFAHRSIRIPSSPELDGTMTVVSQSTDFQV